MRFSWRVLFAAVGACLGALVLLWVVRSMAADLTYLLFVFPSALLAVVATKGSMTLFVAIAILQMIAYGWAVGAALERGKARMALVYLLVLHLAAVTAAVLVLI